MGDLADVGSYTGSASPNGTFDQGGNVWEWNEAIINVFSRGLRGGPFDTSPLVLAASNRSFIGPSSESDAIGFRVAAIPAPEPAMDLLVTISILGLAFRCSCRS